MANIQNNLKMIAFAEQLKPAVLPPVVLPPASQAETPAMVPAEESAKNATKAGNIFAPKPIHSAAKPELSRIGRSHSMFVANYVKPEDSSADDKVSEEEKQSEAMASQLDNKKDMLDGAGFRK